MLHPKQLFRRRNIFHHRLLQTARRKGVRAPRALTVSPEPLTNIPTDTYFRKNSAGKSGPRTYRASSTTKHRSLSRHLKAGTPGSTGRPHGPSTTASSTAATRKRAPGGRIWCHGFTLADQDPPSHVVKEQQLYAWQRSCWWSCGETRTPARLSGISTHKVDPENGVLEVRYDYTPWYHVLLGREIRGHLPLGHQVQVRSENGHHELAAFL